jgi:hypothetical protein
MAWPPRPHFLIHQQFREGLVAAVDAVLQELIEKYAQDWSYNIAYIHAYRQDIEGAFHWLDAAVRFADLGVSLIVAEPLFANLNDDGRWAAGDNFSDSGGAAPIVETGRFPAGNIHGLHITRAETGRFQ